MPRTGRMQLQLHFVMERLPLDRGAFGARHGETEVGRHLGCRPLIGSVRTKGKKAAPCVFNTVFHSKRWNGRIDQFHQNHAADFACCRSGIVRRGLRHLINCPAMGAGKIPWRDDAQSAFSSPCKIKSARRDRLMLFVRKPVWYAPMIRVTWSSKAKTPRTRCAPAATAARDDARPRRSSGPLGEVAVALAKRWHGTKIPLAGVLFWS
jgi:hypothetical protein